VALNLGEATAAASTNGRPPPGLDAPPALRGHRPAWRDPRLWVGILLVAGSVVLGARVLAAADDTVQVWAAAGDLGAGQRIRADDLVAERVRFADADALAGYFTVDDELPADLQLLRGVAAGELLPRAAVGSAADSDLVQVPIAVEADQVPGSVGTGSVVDVYLVAAGAGADAAASRGPRGPALAEVAVVEAPPLEESFTATGKRQLVLAVGERDARRFFRLLGSADSPVLTVVRRG
jgi:hypothetical protein